MVAPTVLAGLGTAAVLVLAGCGSASETSARETADRFESALGSSDPGQACGLLAPDTADLLESLRPEGCEQALPALDLPHDQISEIAVWGDAAQARAGDDVLFLRELQDGWHVVAAGCKPRGGDRPYECELGGP
jgi:hypothetical protein